MTRERLQQKLAENHERLRQLRERRDGVEQEILDLMWANDALVESLNSMRETPELRVVS